VKIEDFAPYLPFFHDGKDINKIKQGPKREGFATLSLMNHTQNFRKGWGEGTREGLGRREGESKGKSRKECSANL